MTKKTNLPEYQNWVENNKERVSFAFCEHVRTTAEATERPHLKAGEITPDESGRVHWLDLERCLEKSNIDPSFTFDCAYRLGGVHLNQVGAMFNAAPNLNAALDVLISNISYFDDRMMACKQTHGDQTTFCMFYRRPLDADFFHTQAAAIFLNLLDSWPTHYTDNSSFNFPRTSKTQKTTLKAVLASYAWVSVEFDKLPYLSWTVETEKLLWPAPNFNPMWWEHCQKFLRWTLDNLASVEDRKPWSRFTTASMMCDPRRLTAETACTIAGVSNKTLSKKLASEGYTAAQLKTWILHEYALRAMCYDVPEEWIAEQFGYTVADLRASFKRRGVTNPYLSSSISKEAHKLALIGKLFDQQIISPSRAPKLALW